jgi:FAD/FMN-containing dehydrogenase
MTKKRTQLALKDPRALENELSWYRLRVNFLRQPTAAEMVDEARKSDRDEARAAVAALRNHLAAGTPPPPSLAEFLVEALTKIAEGEDANLALGVRVGNAPRMSRFYRKKAAYAMLQLVSQGAGVEDAGEAFAEHLLKHVRAAKAQACGQPVDFEVLEMDAEEIAFWSGRLLTQRLMIECYREYKQEMLEVLHSIR